MLNIAIRSLNELDDNIRSELEKQAENLFSYASTSKVKRNCAEMVEFSKSHFIKNSNAAFNPYINVLNLNNGIYDFDRMQLVP